MSSRVRILVARLDGCESVRVSVGIGIYDRRDAVPPLKVPERFRSGIIRIAELPQTGFDQLISALEKAPRFKDIRELQTWISDVSAISEADRKEIISAVIPMFRVQRNAEVTPDKFSTDIWESLREFAPASVAGIDRDVFLARIPRLLAQPSLEPMSSRISDVKGEVERNFCKIRVLTDLRAAFGEDVDETPSDMAVIHNFQIGYHDGMGEHHEFYISLDANDLESLKKAITRAEKKAATLERLADKAGVRIHR